ncbi:MAG TPA: hypothetical protein VEB86_17330 [Chryseosolibacter sp.]|nr:hypothetical protein [Chryseosolibacter sp.]
MKKILSVLTIVVLVATLTSCEQKILVESAVDEDGAIERAITFTEVDSSKVNRNMFGLEPGESWKVDVTAVNDTASNSSDKKFTIRYSRRFPSVAEANAEFDNDRDTLFHIQSTFRKEFRWFYTYIHYADTYRAINRFTALPTDKFFAAEDLAFINRLPAEGKKISKADSVFLHGLTEKMYVQYTLAAIFEENFNMVAAAAKKENLEQRWIDSLTRYKNEMFDIISDKPEEEFIFEDPFMLQLIDSLQIAFPADKIADEYRRLYNSEFAPRLKLMLEASQEGKFTHVIKVPWAIVETNADSVTTNALYWNPPIAKFALKDYTMFATARRLNYWAVVLSAIVVLAAVFIIFCRKR